MRPILVVEDNPDDEELILLALKDNKIANDVAVTRDGVQAVEYLFGNTQAKRTPGEMPALILLDLKLPKLSGFDVLKRLRSDPRTKAIPVVILTSSKEERDIAEGYKLGVNSYVRKPIEFNEFQKVVTQLGIYWLMLNEIPEGSAA